MSSRARGTCLGRRSCAPARTGPEAGHCEKDGVMMVGKPDKMAARRDAQLRSRVISSLWDRFECKRHVSRPRWSAPATGLLLLSKNRFAVGKLPSLCGDADDMRLSDWPLPGWAGGTTDFPTTPLLLCTTTSRRKDDLYRGAFPCTSGEICFWWTEFWTGRRRTEKRGIFLKVADEHSCVAARGRFCGPASGRSCKMASSTFQLPVSYRTCRQSNQS